MMPCWANCQRGPGGHCSNSPCLPLLQDSAVLLERIASLEREIARANEHCKLLEESVVVTSFAAWASAVQPFR